MQGSERIGKLRWLCRRGMKELDVLLESFLDRHRPELEAGAFPQLEELLRAEDDLLWDWLQHPDSGLPERFTVLITALRRGA